MSKLRRVSLIICSYNGGVVLEKCLDSILESTYRDIEIIVVNNTFKNKNFLFLNSKYTKNKLIKVVDAGGNRFFTGGNNLGATRATGEKLIFLNDDTVVDAKFIENLVKYARKNKRYLVQPKVLKYHDRKIIDNVGGQYSWLGVGIGRGQNQKDQGQFGIPVSLSYTVGTVFMIDANFFWKIGGFDEWFKYHYEDVDLSFRARKNGGECWYCPEAVVYHKGSLTVKKLIPKELKLNVRKNRLMVVIKNFSGFEKWLRLIICLVYSFDGARPVFDKSVQNFIDNQRLQELLDVTGSGNKNLLDVGCGDGNFVSMARRKGVEAWGIDKEPRVSNKYISPEPVESFGTGKKYDLITMFHVLEHLRGPLGSLSKLSDYLKRGGYLVIEVPLVGNLSEKFLKKEYFAYFDKTHVNLWPKEKWLRLIRKAGLTPVRWGTTSYEFPLALVGGGFRLGFIQGLVGLILFVPFKVLTLLGFNDEIVRIYCIKKLKK